MIVRKNLTGVRSGLLKVLGIADRTAHGTRWLCRCRCGNLTKVYSYNLQGESKTISCGCLRLPAVVAAITTHGEARTNKRSPEYRSWYAMKQRCLNPHVKQYKDYGGRGITVSRRWLKYENFLMDMGRRPTVKHTIERKNNDNGYNKRNCKWATRKEQAANRRSSR